MEKITKTLLTEYPQNSQSNSDGFSLRDIYRKSMLGKLTQEDREYYITYYMTDEEKEIGKPLFDMNSQERLEYNAICENNKVGTLTGYDCPICKNKGEIWGVANGSEFVKECECMNTRRVIKAMERSGLGHLLSLYKFENYKCENDWQTSIFNKAQAFVKDTNNKWFVMLGESGCVDCDTEFFNGIEWKKISNYNNDQVLQYNPLTKEATLTTPKRYIKAQSNELFKIDTVRGCVDMCLSEEHNFAYITSRGNMTKRPFKEVVEMHNNNKRGFSGKIETAFTYNGVGIDLSENEIRLMCAVIADGYFGAKIRQCTIRVKKERKKERLRELLKGLDYKEYKCKDNFSQFMFYAPRREKEFTDFWYNCNQQQMLIIKDEIFNWDGYIDKKGRKAFFTTSKKSADFIQFILSATGTRSVITKDKRLNGIHKNICYRVNAVKGSSLVSLICVKNETKAKILKYTPKDGYKYCFEVETGYLVLRRNGRIFITGNSGKSMICTAIARELLKQRLNLVFMAWLDDSTELKQFITDGGKYGEKIREYKEADVLYIDDFFKSENNTRPSAADIKLANEILNYRYNKARMDKSKRWVTLISSERTVQQLLEYDKAIAGRLIEMSSPEYLTQVVGVEKNYRLRNI